jgi:hypothetical protein
MLTTTTTTSTPASPSSELSHASIGQWGAVIAGVLGGFAATLLMTTLGAALGLTAGAALVDESPTLELGAGALGTAAIVWTLVTAVVVGITGGVVVARSSRTDRSYHPGVLGLLAWTGGMVLAGLIAAPGAVGALASIGGVGASHATANPDLLERIRFDGVADAAGPRGDAIRASDATGSRAALTPAEQQRLRAAAEEAAEAAAALAWIALAAQILSLVATIGAAKWQRRRFVATEPIGYATVVP